MNVTRASYLWCSAVCSILLMSLSGSLEGQTAGQTRQSSDSIWQLVADRPARPNLRRSITRPFAVVRLNKQTFDARINLAPREGDRTRAAGVVMTLPMPDGTFARFRVVESPIVAPELAAVFPGIRTYSGQGIDDPTATARFGWTAVGFHSIILSAAGTVYVDPYAEGDLEHYSSFRKEDLEPAPFICLVDAAARDLPRPLNVFPIVHGDTLREYRLALAATGEYTVAAGGTKALALARMTITINRVNGIYERDLAVRLSLVTGTPADPTALIYTDGTTDPYTNSDGFVMLNENQANVDAVIGSASYDIGHVFSTAGGGIALTPSVCALDFKAGGVSGLPNPTGDVFDVDYVSHEIGHQFGGHHTFNGLSGSCQGSRSAANAFEVGSGSTILAYAGLCGEENLQRSTHDYFHLETLNSITAYITSGAGASCGVASATGNTPPVVNAGVNYTIPRNTPFTLVATGSDANGDAITYVWDQDNLGAASSSALEASTDDGTRPLFRSYPPTASASRTFPSLPYVLNNANAPPTTYNCEGFTCLTGEVLPSMSRTLEFQVTARDNRAGGGGIATSRMEVAVESTAGPFRVTAPNSAVRFAGGSSQTVTWDQAATHLGPINVANVKISLSTDGGLTFPTVLLATTPNDGSEQITLPHSPTTAARIKVEAVGNIFFDISDSNFTITATVTPPGSPTNINVTRGNGQVTVSFTPPVNTGGAAITSYTATASPGGATAIGGASPLTVTGLTNGTSYTFTVTATNSVGTGPASAVSAPVIPATVPGPPTAVSAVAGNAQALVSFAAPASNGGAAITSFTVTARSSGIVAATATGSASPVIIAPLTNGVAYTFTVRANNDVGPGAESGPSTAVTPFTPGPATPANFAVSASGLTVMLSWTTSAAGSPPTGHLLEVGVDGEFSPVIFSQPLGAVNALNLTAPPGTAGVFLLRLTAFNAAGASAPTAAQPLSLPGLPPAPGPPLLSPAVTSGNTVTLNWTSGPGGRPERYELIVGSSSGQSDFGVFPMGPATSISAGAPDGTYFVRVQAANAGGSALSNEIMVTLGMPCVPPAPPTNVVARRNGVVITVNWAPPASGTGTLSYTLVAGSMPGTSDVGTFELGAVQTISAAAPRGSYFIRVRARNACGVSSDSTEVFAVIP
jgi:hypothetical protein